VSYDIEDIAVTHLLITGV